MSAIPQYGFMATGMAVAFNVTTYFSVLGGRGSILASTTETDRQITYRTGGTFSKWTVTASANTIATSATTVRPRINAADVNGVVSIAAGATGIFQDGSNSDSITAGDEVAGKVVTPNTSGSITLQSSAALFAASSNTTTHYDKGPNSGASNNITLPEHLSGNNGAPGTANEDFVQVKFKAAGTLKNLFSNVVTNPRTTTTTMRSRINGANGNMAISITAGATGLFEDSSNTDTIAVDDLVNYSRQMGASAETITFGIMAGCEFESTGGAVMALSSGATATVAANLTRYLGIGGDGYFNTPYVTESHSQTYALVTATLSKLSCRLSANTVTATSTLKSRINGADGGQSVSITASTAGFFEDGSGSDSVVATDTVSYQLITGATGTSMDFRNTAMLIALPVSGVFIPIVGRGPGMALAGVGGLAG